MMQVAFGFIKETLLRASLCNGWMDGSLKIEYKLSSSSLGRVCVYITCIEFRLEMTEG